MADLKTTYMGLTLSNPIIAGSSTHTMTADRVEKLESAGVGAVVLKSLFEEQIRVDVADMVMSLEQEPHAEAYDYLRADLPMRLGPETYLDRIQEIQDTVTCPVIASVNCVHADQWVAFAHKIEAAGADAIELNVYDVPESGDIAGADVEQRHLDVVAAVVAESTIPVAVKIGPYYSSLPNFVERLAALDIRAIVMFNRFFQPDIDIDGLGLKSGINYSRPDDIRLPMRWIAMLRNRIAHDLSLTGGVHHAEGVIKGLLAGADTVQVCSALYEQGPDVIGRMLAGLQRWMQEKGFETLSDFRGQCCEPETRAGSRFARAQYVKALVGLE